MQEKPTASEGKSNRFQNSYILQAWLVLLLALCFGISLAGVQAALGPQIDANKLNETMAKVPEIILGPVQAAKMMEANRNLMIQQRSISIKKQNRQKMYSVYETHYPDGKAAGWVVKASGQGYADKIELLFGLTPQGAKLTGLFVLDQKETPGLGNKIIEEKWRNQFVQKPAGQPLTVVKTGARAGNEIDAVTGATISSKSVINIINNTLSDIQGELAMMTSERPKD